MKRFKLLLLILLLCSCRSKKESVERTILVDTMQTKSFEYISKPIQTTFEISDLCDSVGNVRQFKKTETSGDNQTNIETRDNKLILDLFTGQSKTKTDTIYKTKYKDVLKTNEVVKYRSPFLHWILHVILLIVLFLYLRRYIPFI